MRWVVMLLPVVGIRFDFIGRIDIGLIVTATSPTPRAPVYFIQSGAAGTSTCAHLFQNA